jgi:general stress protein 26
MDLQDIKAKAAALSPWAHLATVGADGKPDVVPVHPCWEGDTLWIMGGSASVKARNIAANPNVALHWQVTEAGDGVEIWGTASVHDDLDTKRRLWTGVFDYDLNLFAPGGPEQEGTCFVAVHPERALYLATYGMQGTFRWSKGADA